jgi:hypothetical protein
MKKVWTWGLGAGAIAAALDLTLILLVDAGVSRWVLLEAASFWVVAGWVVVSSETGLGRYAHGIVTTVLLNLPWYVVEAFASGHPEHFPPLVGMSIVFGAGFAWARGRARSVAAAV